MRLIDADEVQKIIDHVRTKYKDSYNMRNKVTQLFWDTIRYIEKKVRAIPTVEAKPVVHGEWVHSFGDEWCCSACGDVICTEGSWDKPKANFCEECGADMRKKVE